MSTEYRDNQRMVMDLYDRNTTACHFPVQEDNSDSNVSKESEQSNSSNTGRTSISENLWEETKKRHCDSRQHWRHLLDRYVRPHHS